MKAARGHDVLIFVCNEQGMTLGAFGNMWNTVAGNAELCVFAFFKGWGRQKYSFPSPRVSLGGTRSFLSKNLPEHCITNHGVLIKCIFDQLDRISNVVACLPQAGLTCYKLARRRTNILHKQSGWILLRRVKTFLSAEMANNLRQKLRFYEAARTRNKSQYTVKNTTTCPNCFSIIRARPPALTP